MLLLSGAALLGLAAVCTAADAIPSGALPATCYTTHRQHRSGHASKTAGVETHGCYTRTSTVMAASCPSSSCPPKATDLICPDFIKISQVTVPCSTDCCPATPTVTAAVGSCTTCDPCHIPTEWITYMTGCPGTSTITSATIVTPA
ncbi:hypothetical protein GGR56DRAFT_349719 [Xylariaceae sp. FL0804]|nr:hypothetical protein GGR56DRAFT_349719 [Xylariaceae sp. FL0804]